MELNRYDTVRMPGVPVIVPQFKSGVALELGEYILQCKDLLAEKNVKINELNSIITSIKLAAKCVNCIVTKHNTFIMDDEKNKNNNVDIDPAETLAKVSNKTFMNAIINRKAVAGVTSALESDFVAIESCQDQELIVLVHPMDGLKHVDVNVSSGSIFSVYKRITHPGTSAELKDFLQPGINQICSGYVLYGSSTILVLTIGKGVHGFTLDPSLGSFFMSHPNIRMPERGSIYSINGGKINKFPAGVKEYIEYCQNKQISCRYIGSVVADFHRNMLKGGIYIYPPTFTDPVPSISMIFQCNPLAFLAEQAGGKASDGFTRILLINPTSLSDRIAFFCGSTTNVESAEVFMAKNKLKDGGWSYSKRMQEQK